MTKPVMNGKWQLTRSDEKPNFHNITGMQVTEMALMEEKDK